MKRKRSQSPTPTEVESIKKGALTDDILQHLVKAAPYDVILLFSQTNKHWQTKCKTFLADEEFHMRSVWKLVQSLEESSKPEEKNSWKISPPITKEQKSKLDQALGFPLPKEFSTFLDCANGFSYYVDEQPNLFIGGSSEDEGGIQHALTYNDTMFGIFVRKKWFPFFQIDYDFCQNVYSTMTKEVFCVDGERGDVTFYAPSLVRYIADFAIELQLFRQTGKKWKRGGPKERLLRATQRAANSLISGED